MRHRRLSSIRTRLFLRQSRWAFASIAAWVAMGTLAFRHVAGVSYPVALQNALYLGRERGWFWDLYSMWGQCILFGIFVSVFLMQAVQRSNPEEVCRMLASEMKGHTIVVGYTHLGARIIDDLREKGRPFVLIEKDPAAVDHLVRLFEPVIIDNAKLPGTLEEAGVHRAEAVIVASDNIETALLVTKRAREANRSVRIIVRCFQDEFAEILEGLGADDVISSSKSAFREVCDRLKDPRA